MSFQNIVWRGAVQTGTLGTQSYPFIAVDNTFANVNFGWAATNGKVLDFVGMPEEEIDQMIEALQSLKIKMKEEK